MNSGNNDRNSTALDTPSRIQSWAGGAEPSTELTEVESRQLWRILRRRRRMILWTIVSFVVISALATLLWPRKYDGKTTLQLDFQSSDIFGIEQVAQLGESDMQTKLDTQTGVLQSETLAIAVMKELDLPHNKDFAGRYSIPASESIDKVTPEERYHLLDRFNDDLDVQVQKGMELIQVRFRCPDPVLSAKVANSLTNHYIAHAFETKYQDTLQAADWLSKQLEDIKHHTELAEQKLADFQQKTGMIGTDEGHTLELSGLMDLSKQLSVAQSERVVKEAEYRMVSTRNPEVIASIASGGALPLLRQQETAVKSQLADLTKKFGPNYPKVQQAKEQVASVDKMIDAEIDRMLSQSKREYEAASKAESLLQAKVDGQRQTVLSRNQTAMEFAMLVRDVKSSRDLYEDLMRRLNEAGVIAGLKSTNASILDSATVPWKPSIPNIPLNLSLGLLLGIIFGLGGAIVLESVDTSIGSADQVEIEVGLPILAVVPRFLSPTNDRGRALPVKVGVGPITVTHPKTPAAEAFRALRTSLLLSAGGAPPRVILFTSAAPGEGKSTIASNCAVVLAQSNKRVLLVDADMRRPTAWKQFGVDRGSMGLSDCIAGESFADSVHRFAGVPGLSVLTGGSVPPNPSELLSSPAMRELLARWREEFDHVVIDSPPVMAVTDSVILSPMADVVALVARAGQSRRHPLLRARKILAASKAHVAGVVVNDVIPNSDGYLEYYGYSGSKYEAYYNSGNGANEGN